MSVTRIAARYAKSLIELASEQDRLVQVHADVTALHAATRNRDLMLMLKSPIIQGEKKNAALNALFGSSMDKLTMAYMRLLVTKGREAYLPEIAAEFIQQYKNRQKITSVRVTTAAPISDAVLDEVRKKLLASGVTNPNLDIEAVVDADLIGGYVLEFDNKRYDASVAFKLDELKTQFTKNLYVKEF
jgi:F-type H+-transporting ATPase subunit delta